MACVLRLQEGVLERFLIASPFLEDTGFFLQAGHLDRLGDLDLAVPLQLVRPQAANEYDYGSKGSMDDEGVKVNVVELREIDGLVALVLEIVKDDMVQADKDQQGDVQLPVLVGDQDGTGNKGKKVHFE